MEKEEKNKIKRHGDRCTHRINTDKKTQHKKKIQFLIRYAQFIRSVVSKRFFIFSFYMDGVLRQQQKKNNIFK